MSRIGEAASSTGSSTRQQGDVFHGHVDATRAHQEVLRGLDGKQACPFCGSVSERSASPCARCGMDNTPEARKATKQRIGPWYVLQARNPAAPGMRFETLLSFVRKGRVRARSVVRGPTTHQLWRFAAHVKGLSREFGMCFSCGSVMETTANICPQCNRLQEPPVNPDVLLENDSEESSPASRQPVFRELPNLAESPAPEPHAHGPEDVDIIIPALGGFGMDDTPDPKFSEAPVAAAAAAPPMHDTFSTPPLMSPPVVPPVPALKPANRPAPRNAPAESNPLAISGPRRKGNGGGGDAASFLSAKELAAAFKLSFDPSAQMETVEVPDEMPASAMPDGMRPGAIMPRNPMGLATQTVPAHEPVRRGGAFRKFVLFVLILVGTGFGLLMWVDPGARKRAVEWTKSTYNRLHRYATGADGKPAPTAEANAPAPMDEVPDPPALKVTPPAPAPKPESAQTAPAESGDTTRADAPEKEAPAAVEQPAPRPELAIPAKPKPAPNPPASDPSVNPEERMLELRTASYAASKKGDYKTALKLWEEMGELPAQYRDTLYQTRLKYLREQVE